MAQTDLERALALYPSAIYYQCGHNIPATIGMIESLDDGVDLSVCPACKQRHMLEHWDKCEHSDPQA